MRRLLLFKAFYSFGKELSHLQRYELTIRFRLASMSISPSFKAHSNTQPFTIVQMSILTVSTLRSAFANEVCFLLFLALPDSGSYDTMQKIDKP